MFTQIHLVTSRCLYETTLTVEPIDRVHLPTITSSELALLAQDKYQLS
jgi:hypothetical protein